MKKIDLIDGAVGSGMKLHVTDEKANEEIKEWSPLDIAEVKTPRRIGSIWRAKRWLLRGGE